MKKIIIPIPSYCCDPSEVAIPWKLLSQNNIQVVFATPNGDKGVTDQIMLTGKGLGLLKGVLAAREDARMAYHELKKSKEFNSPINYESISETDFDGILLPGGHDKLVKEYLESSILQDVIVRFFAKNKPVAAVCHGVVLLARSIDPKTQKSVLFNYKTTSLLKSQERAGYNLTRLWMKDYYLTYPDITVEDEVRSVLENPENFLKGPFPVARDNFENMNRGFVVKDRNYLSARWPGDLYNFSTEFIKMLKE